MEKNYGKFVEEVKLRVEKLKAGGLSRREDRELHACVTMPLVLFTSGVTTRDNVKETFAAQINDFLRRMERSEFR